MNFLGFKFEACIFSFFFSPFSFSFFVFAFVFAFFASVSSIKPETSSVDSFSFVFCMQLFRRKNGSLLSAEGFQHCSRVAQRWFPCCFYKLRSYQTGQLLKFLCSSVALTNTVYILTLNEMVKSQIENKELYGQFGASFEG